VTVTVVPATASVAVLLFPPFAATETVTVPLPNPLAPSVIAAHGAVELAVQAQPGVVLTVRFTSEPAEGIETFAGVTLNEHAVSGA